MPVTVRIEGEGPTGSGYRVFLNDEEVSRSTRSISLEMGGDDVNIATLEVYVDRVELSADVEAQLVRVDGDERTSFASRFREWIKS